MYENVHESRSIGQFLLNNARKCPREALYWTVLTEKCSKMSESLALLDSSNWKTHETDHDRPFYWTVL